MSRTFQRTQNWVHSVTAEDVSSGYVILTIVSDVPASGTTDDFLWVQQVKRVTTGVEIPGFSGLYETTSGTLTIANAGAVSLTSGDVLTVIGTFYR